MNLEQQMNENDSRYKSQYTTKGKRVNSQGPSTSKVTQSISSIAPSQNQNFHLEQIIGLTASSSHQIAINQITGDLAYTAGSVIVIYSPATNKQTKYFSGASKAQVQSIMFTNDGKYLVSGEGNCKNPVINIWDMNTLQKIITQPMMQLKGHKYSINQLIQSPSQYQYLVSLGSSHDRGLFVWDLSDGNKKTVNKLSKNVFSATFDMTGRVLATCGVQHLKFWYFEDDGKVIPQKSEKEDLFIMEPKSLYLNEKFIDKTFIDLVLYQKNKNEQIKLFTLTSDSQLCIFSEQTRQLDRWMDLKVQLSFGMTLLQNFIICNCSDSIIRVFNADTFSHITTLHKPPNLGNYNIEKGITKLKQASPDDQYADCVGLITDQKNKYLIAIYSDRTLFIWDIKNFQKVSVKRSFLNHSGPIYDLQMLPLQSSEEVTFFVTASSDKTMRIWHYYDESTIQNCQNSDISNLIGIRRNVYCKNLSKILYIEDQDFSHFKRGNQQNDEQNSLAPKNLTYQVKCVKISKDGKYLACGDFLGVLRVYSTQNFVKDFEIQSHEQEITSIDFTIQNNLGLDYLATGSRDRLIHVYDVYEKFHVVATLDEHTSSITQLKFAYLKENQTLILISCSADRSIIFREYTQNPDFPIPLTQQSRVNISKKIFQIYHQEIDKHHKILSMELSHNHQTLYVGSDKKISLYQVNTGKYKSSWESKDDQKINNLENLKLCLDCTGSYLAVYNNDKVLRVRDCQHNNVVAKLKQGDSVTGMLYTFNNKHFITSGYDGCIFIWRLSQEVKTQIEKKKGQLGIIAKKLKEVFADQELKMSKEWTINSFWIEEELKGFLSQQKEKQITNDLHNLHLEQSQLIQNESQAMNFEKVLEANKENFNQYIEQQKLPEQQIYQKEEQSQEIKLEKPYKTETNIGQIQRLNSQQEYQNLQVITFDNDEEDDDQTADLQPQQLTSTRYQPYYYLKDQPKAIIQESQFVNMTSFGTINSEIKVDGNLNMPFQANEENLTSAQKMSISRQFFDQINHGEFNFSPTQSIDHYNQSYTQQCKTIIFKQNKVYEESQQKFNAPLDFERIKAQMQEVQQCMNQNIKNLDNKRQQKTGQSSPIDSPKEKGIPQKEPDYDGGKAQVEIEQQEAEIPQFLEQSQTSIYQQPSHYLPPQDSKLLQNVVEESIQKKNLHNSLAPDYRQSQFNQSLQHPDKGISRESINLNYSIIEDQQQFQHDLISIDANHPKDSSIQDESQILFQQQAQKKVKSQALQYTNLIQCHFRTIIAELQGVEQVMSQLNMENNEELKQIVKKNVTDNALELRQSLNILNQLPLVSKPHINVLNPIQEEILLSEHDQHNQSHSILEHSKLSEIDISIKHRKIYFIENVLIQNSRELLDNYSKMLIQEISKQLKNN